MENTNLLPFRKQTVSEEDQSTENMQILEAFLFIQEKEVETDRITKLLEISPGEIEMYVNHLNIKYRNNGHGIRIISTDGKYRLDILSDVKEKLNELKKENFDELTSIVDEFLYVMQSEGNQESSIYNYGLLLKKFIKDTGKKVTDITLRDMRLFLMREKNEKGNSNSTINHKKSMIKSFFNWLELEGKIEKNPARRLKKSKEKDKAPNPFSHEQIEKLRDAADEKQFDRMLLEVLYSSGLRISEARNLNWSDLDFAEQLIYVRNGKGGKDRVTFLSTKAVMLLKEYKSQRNDDKEFVFRSRYNKRMSRNSLYRHIKEIGNRAGMNNDETDNVKPHRFRHSFASHLLESGMELHKVQRLLGHSDPGTTQIYARTNQADVEHSYRKVFH